MIFEVLSEFTHVYTNFSNDRSQTFREPFYRSPSQTLPGVYLPGPGANEMQFKDCVIYVIDLNVQKIPEN